MMDHPIWEEDSRRWTSPTLITPEAWATFTASQRAMVNRHRMAVVAILQTDHERRYHHGRNMIRWLQAVDGPPDDAT